MLDKHSPVPLYYQLVETLRDQIRAGALKPGEQLPGERELSEQFSISRMTVRQALQYLVREEALTARQGLGTFVAEPKLTHDPLHVLGFTEEMMRHGAAASSRVIEQAVVTPSPGVAAQLALSDDELTTRIVRLRLSDGVPMLLETVHMPTRRFAGLERTNLSKQSLYQLMHDRYGIRPAGTHHTIEAVPANDFESELFGIEASHPMILVQGVTYDDDDQPVECFKAVYRGDRFKIQLNSRASEPRDAPSASAMSVVMH